MFNKTILNILCLFMISNYAFSQHKYTFDFSNTSLDNKEIRILNTSNISIGFEGEKIWNKLGEPKLPVKYVKLIIPQSQKVIDFRYNEKINNQKYENREILFNEPVKNYHTINDFEYYKHRKEEIKNLSTFPQNQIEVVDDGYFDGDKHIVTLAVFPIKYHPIDNTLEIIETISFDLIFGNTEVSNVKSHKIRKKKNDKFYKDILASIVYNKNEIDFYYQEHPHLDKASSITSVPYYEYVIITSTALSSSFDKFINWKTRKGLDIGVVTTSQIYSNYSYGDQISGINDNQGSIRQYLHDAWEGGAVWVLIVGDYSVVPFRRVDFGTIFNDAQDSPTDCYYADFTRDWEYDGNPDGRYGFSAIETPDFNVEVFVGRLLCTTSTEIENWINKVILYEQNPGRGNTSYLNKMFIQEADEPQDEGGATAVTSALPTNIFTREIFSEDSSGNDLNPVSPSGNQIINELNELYGNIGFMGHGTPVDIVVRSTGYNQNDGNRYVVTSTNSIEKPGNLVSENSNGLDNITNPSNPAIFYASSCNTTPFDNFDTPSGYKNFGEIFTTMATNGGAAYLGNTRNSFVNASRELFVNFWSVINRFSSNSLVLHLGVAESFSRIETSLDKHVRARHNLIGCPETQIWVGTPSSFSSVNISDNGSSITVNAVSGSNICVSSLDNGVTYHQLEDNVSSATFNTSTRPLYITVTKTGYLPYCAITGGTITTNTSFYEKIIILDNLTVNPGVTLDIDGNSTIQVKTGKQLIVNGALNVNGTSSSPVTFNVSGTGTWGGIEFNNGSSGSISYAVVKNATNGIAFNNLGTSYITVSNCTIEDNTNAGIYLYNSSPIIGYNTIRNNNYGIHCYNYSSPSIHHNNIYGNTYHGVYLNYYSPAYVSYWSSGPGGNHIYNNNKGIFANYQCNAFVYWNSIENNTSYELHGDQSLTIDAEENWWGVYPPTSSNVYASGGASIDYSPALQTTPLAKANFSIASTTGKLQKSDNSDLERAWELQLNEKYEEAIEIYSTILDSEQESETGILALIRIEECYTKLKRKDFASFIEGKGFIKSDKKSKLSAVATELLCHELINQKDFKSLLNRYTELLEDYKEYSDLRKNTLYNMGYLNYAHLGNKTNAEKYFALLEEEFPNDQLVLDSWLLKGKDVKNYEAFDKSIEKADEQTGEDELPNDYKLLGNYPNPFNPSTVIKFSLPVTSNVTLTIYNMMGEEIKTITSNNLSEGVQQFTWNGTNKNNELVSSGIYIYRIQAVGNDGRSFTKSAKMTLLK